MTDPTLATRMGCPATYGSLKEFNPDRDRITPYLERMALYLQANRVPNDDKVAVFLSIIGGQVYSLLRDLLAPSLPQDTSYDTLVTTLKRHYEPKPLEIAERYHFYRRCQGANETIAQFVAELRRLAVHCNFEAHLDQALRDRLVCGLRSDSIQKKLLSEATLTLARAIEISQGMEAAEKNVRSLKEPEPQVNHLAGSSRVNSMPRSKPSACYRCGRTNHTQNNCRYINATCNSCGKKGHISPVCMSSGKPSGQPPKPKHRGNRQPKRANWVNVDESNTRDSPDLQIYCLPAKSSRAIGVDLQINGKPLHMEVDTGAAVSLISREVHERQFPDISLAESQIRLQTYTGEPIPILGEMKVQVRYGKQCKPLVLRVVEGNGPSLFGRDWLEQLRLNWKQIGAVSVERDSPLSVDQLCTKFDDVFKDELGYIHSFEASLKVDERVRPKFFKARSVPYSIRDATAKELDELEAAGVIEEVAHSEWATPLVVLPKPNGKVRICGDFKVTLNPDLEVDQYPLPKPEDLFATLSGGKQFTHLDLAQAFLQLPLEDKSQKLVVINTHKGLYKYKRLPFGVASSPAIFQKVMDQILQGIPGVIWYIDDILITGKTKEEHLQRLEEVLSRLQANGLRANKPKCKFLQDQCRFLGHIIDAEGLHTSDEKIEAITKAPHPRNVKELRSFLGMMNYYRKFIPNLATVLKPMTNLLQHNVRWHWNARCIEAFKESKRLLTCSPVLVHYDPTLPMRLATDASAHGIGAVISHVFPNGDEKPIAFSSRTLSTTECNYAQIEKEALGIIYGLKKFHQYLYGRKFTLITDHKPLTTIFGPKKGVPALAAARLQRWAIQMSAYQYDIEFRPTDRHANADGLSRLPLKGNHPEEGKEVKVFQIRQIESLPVTADHIRKATRTDRTLRKVLEYTRHGWPSQMSDDLKPYLAKRNELSIEGQCLLWGMRVVIPTSIRKHLLQELHRDHPGISKMKSLARSHMWWPGIDGEIETVAKSCQPCHEAKQAPAKAPLHPWSWPSKPWQRVHLDYAGPFMGKSFLLAIDAHSKWGEVYEMSSTTAFKTIEVLRQMFAAYGLPSQIVTDNGPQFVSEEFASFMKANGVKHTRCTPYHPASNGEAERFVRTFKESMKASRYEGMTLSHRLQNFLLLYRSTPHSTTNVAPCELFLGRTVRTRLDLLKPDPAEHVMQQQAKQKEKHDLRARYRDLHIGQKVMVRNMRTGPTWIPGEIIQQLGPVTYLVDVYGEKPWKCHADQLKERVETPNPLRSEIPSQLPEEESDTDVGPDPVVEIGSTPAGSDQEPIVDGPEVNAEPANPSTDDSNSTPQPAQSDPPVEQTERRYPSRNRNPPDRYH